VFISSLTLIYPSRVKIVTLAGSKINSSKFYYCEKSVNLHSCSLIGWLYTMAKAQGSNVNNDLETSQDKAVNLAGQIVTSANIVG
jgi:hypothetical protein